MTKSKKEYRVPAGQKVLVINDNAAHYGRIRKAFRQCGASADLQFISSAGAGLKGPFFSTKPVGTGTGLGLSISHGIIAEHGGTIRAESQEGRGATFIIEIPCRGPDKKALAIREATQNNSGDTVRLS